MTDIPVPRGLDGVIVGETRICLPDKQTDRPCHCGYPIAELAAHASQRANEPPHSPELPLHWSCRAFSRGGRGAGLCCRQELT